MESIFSQRNPVVSFTLHSLRCISPPFSPLRLLFMSNFIFSPHIVSWKSVLSFCEIKVLYLPISFVIDINESVNLKTE